MILIVSGAPDPQLKGSDITRILVSSSPPKSGGAYFSCIAYGVGGVLYVDGRGSHVKETE